MPNKRQPGDTTQNWTDKWVASVSDYSICAISLEGRILTWNRGGIVIHGYQPDEIIGQMLDILYIEDDRQKRAPAVGLETARRTGRHDTEGWRVRKDGSTFWASDVTTALHTEDGQPAAYVNIVRDITEKKAAHDAVLESERRFRMLVNGVTDYAVFMLSPEGVVTNWNSGARRIKGYAADEIIGSHFSRFYTAEDAATGLPQRGLTVAARDGRFEAEGWRVRKDGSRFWAHVVIDAIRDEDGTLAGFAKITRDITERREANRVLEETRTALFQSQKMEAIGKLTGGVAHDFNNVLQVSLRNLEEMMAERAIDVDHSTVHRWVIKLVPLFEKTFRKHKRPVGKSWRMDETYIKVKGSWRYLYRAVDKAGNTIDFLFRAKRDKAAARRFFDKAIAQNGAPETVTIDKSGSNLAALHAVNAERETPIKVRQVKYLNNVVEQDHRAIKRRTRPMLGFKDFDCARVILIGIEVMHMIKKGQVKDFGKIPLSAAQQFYSLIS